MFKIINKLCGASNIVIHNGVKALEIDSLLIKFNVTSIHSFGKNVLITFTAYLKLNLCASKSFFFSNGVLHMQNPVILMLFGIYLRGSSILKLPLPYLTDKLICFAVNTTRDRSQALQFIVAIGQRVANSRFVGGKQPGGFAVGVGFGIVGRSDPPMLAAELSTGMTPCRPRPTRGRQGPFSLRIVNLWDRFWTQLRPLSYVRESRVTTSPSSCPPSRHPT